jgi:DNA polymerase III alpha subunit
MLTMKVDTYGNLIFTENDLVELYLTNPMFTSKKEILVETDISFDNSLELANCPKTKKYQELNISINDFDEHASNNWHFPDEYKNFDIAKFVLDQCQDETELQRAGQELLLFQERDMFVLLRYLKYLIDTMRKNNIVWGVGRGSSVASFVLFIIGVHKINPIYYQIDISEFLK